MFMLQEIENDHQRRFGYGACAIFAARMFQKIGGTIVIGDYAGSRKWDDCSRHIWVEKAGKIYDVNNIGGRKLKFYNPKIIDKRYFRRSGMS